MGNRKLLIIRGVPGSGKTTFAKFLKQQAEWGGQFFDSVYHYEADNYFIRGSGEYVFNPAELPKAHAWCQGAVRKALSTQYTAMVIVSNTFSQMWELEPYLQIAKETDTEVTILTVETLLSDQELAERNVHSCPVEAIARIRNRWESFTSKS